MATQARQLGNIAEDIVARYLAGQGYTILARNFATRAGEIDIIAQYDALCIFVEVKMRTKKHFALSQLITPSKQRKIISTARYYAARSRLRNYVLRFDVACVLCASGESPAVSYIKNAFTAPEECL